MQVIVVVDGKCDETVDALHSVNARFEIKTVVQNKAGAAVARNTGAKLARGTILIFLDDDIEAAPSLVQGHVDGHQEKSDVVVIGYLPPIIYSKHIFFEPAIREWWESTFDEMRNKSHRFHYRNLTSGNFSIRQVFYSKVGGFNEQFICQEDYELGLRLIQQGANFQFSDLAMGFHHDTTDFEKIKYRRCQEAQASVLFAKQHPQLIPTLPYLQKLHADPNFQGKRLLNLIYNHPGIIILYEKYLSTRLRISEKLRRRKAWRSIQKTILELQFYKGLKLATSTLDGLKDVIERQNSVLKEKQIPLKLDLRQGIEQAEQKLDEIRPVQVEVYYGEELIGSLPEVPGAENYKGVHLRAILAKRFSWEILKAVSFEPANAMGVRNENLIKQ